MAKLNLKLVVDKEKNRVVFVESGKDFVDILLSFLTLPMGTIIRLLGKQSSVGCIDKLYESVENLDTQYLQTDACKNMLLQPRSELEKRCECLAINVDDLKPRRIYRCPKWECFTKTHCLFATVLGTRCACGEAMDEEFQYTKRKANTLDGESECDGVFVKATARFMISDDLHIRPISTRGTLSLLQKLGISDADALEKMSVDHVSKEEISSLLKRTLLFKTPLTDVFLQKPESMNRDSDTEELKLVGAPHINLQNNAESKKIRVRLLEIKYPNKLVYAEAGEDFVDILFSFLTFPLGYVVKILNKHSSFGCADNLYHSVEVLSLGDDYLKSKDTKSKLLDPKLASHFGCSNQLLRTDENLSLTMFCRGCEICFNESKDKCLHGVKDARQTMINPKLPVPGTEHGGGFSKPSTKFMVTNEMMITPLSPTNGIDVIKELQVPITSLIEREITCGELEVTNLLQACLVSRKALSNVFSSKKRKRKSQIINVI